MKQYRQLKIVLCSVVLAYLGAVVYIEVVVDRHEIFPFFCWSLFSKIPSAQGKDYALLVTQIDGASLYPPEDGITHSGRYLKNDKTSAYYLIQALGKHIVRGKTNYPPRKLRRWPIFSLAKLLLKPAPVGRGKPFKAQRHAFQVAQVLVRLFYVAQFPFLSSAYYR